MFSILIYSLALCWGNVSNSNVTMKFAQLHYFLSQNIGGAKRYDVPPVQKLEGTCPPITTVPGYRYNCIIIHIQCENDA